MYGDRLSNLFIVYNKSIGVSVNMVNQSFLVYDSYTQLYNDRVVVYVTMDL